MKGFINKRDKIKWEDTPFQPEFSAEKIADMIGESEDITDAIIDTVKENVELDDLKNMDTTRIEAGQFLTKDEYGGEWFTALPNLSNLADTSIDPSDLADGDTLVYDGTSYKWKNATPPVWHELDPITADGTSDTVEVTLYDATGVVVDLDEKLAAASAQVTLAITFDGTTWNTVGAINGAIDTTEKFSRFLGLSVGGLWLFLTTISTTNFNAQVSFNWRLSSLTVDGPLKGVRLVATSGSVHEDGSVFNVKQRY